MNFKVEIRKTCKICNKPLTKKRLRTYCSPTCRNKFFNKKYSGMHTEWQRKKRDKEAEKPSPTKIQCLICGKWYVQVCSHTFQIHELSGRSYREYFDLEVKRGVIPKWYRKLKGDQAIENGTFKNLKNGKRYWFVLGDKRAGNYRRSHITLERLRNLHKLKGLDNTIGKTYNGL
jgi:hypothetical protein